LDSFIEESSCPAAGLVNAIAQIESRARRYAWFALRRQGTDIHPSVKRLIIKTKTEKFHRNREP
jgi:hypothetical protein